MTGTTTRKKATPAKAKTKAAKAEPKAPKEETKPFKEETVEEVKGEIKIKAGRLSSRLLNEIEEHFDEISLSKKCDLLNQLLPYVTPKMQSTEIGTMEIDPLATQLGRLSNAVTKE